MPFLKNHQNSLVQAGQDSSFTKTPPPAASKLSPFAAFNNHAAGCSRCNKPLEVVRRGEQLCDEGHAIATDVARTLYQVASEKDGTSANSNISLLFDFTGTDGPVFELCKAMNQSLNRSKSQPVHYTRAESSSTRPRNRYHSTSVPFVPQEDNPETSFYEECYHGHSGKIITKPYHQGSNQGALLAKPQPASTHYTKVESSSTRPLYRYYSASDPFVPQEDNPETSSYEYSHGHSGKVITIQHHQDSNQGALLAKPPPANAHYTRVESSTTRPHNRYYSTSPPLPQEDNPRQACKVRFHPQVEYREVPHTHSGKIDNKQYYQDSPKSELVVVSPATAKKLKHPFRTSAKIDRIQKSRSKIHEAVEAAKTKGKHVEEGEVKTRTSMRKGLGGDEEWRIREEWQGTAEEEEERPKPRAEPSKVKKEEAESIQSLKNLELHGKERPGADAKKQMRITLVADRTREMVLAEDRGEREIFEKENDELFELGEQVEDNTAGIEPQLTRGVNASSYLRTIDPSLSKSGEPVHLQRVGPDTGTSDHLEDTSSLDPELTPSILGDDGDYEPSTKLSEVKTISGMVNQTNAGSEDVKSTKREMWRNDDRDAGPKLSHASSVKRSDHADPRAHFTDNLARLEFNISAKAEQSNRTEDDKLHHFLTPTLKPLTVPDIAPEPEEKKDVTGSGPNAKESPTIAPPAASVVLGPLPDTGEYDNNSESQNPEKESETHFLTEGQQASGDMVTMMADCDTIVTHSEHINHAWANASESTQHQATAWLSTFLDGKEKIDICNVSQEWGLLEKITEWIEKAHGRRVHWWRLRPRKQPSTHSKSFFRVQWTCCTCKKRLVASISDKHAEALKQWLEADKFQRLPLVQASSNPVPNHSTSSSSQGRVDHQLTASTTQPPQRGNGPNDKLNTRSGEGAISGKNQTVSPQNNQSINPTSTVRHLLWCVKPFSRCTYVLHIEILPSDNDSTIFYKMRKNYSKVRGWRLWLSLYNISQIKFIKCKRYYQNKVACGNREELPPHTNPNYDYTPKPNPDVPPIESEVLVHYLEQPDCAASSGAIISTLPKKLNGELSYLEEGWGLQVIEELYIYKIFLLSAIVLSISLISVPLWLWKHPGDIQGAFTIPKYLLGLFELVLVLPQLAGAQL